MTLPIGQTRYNNIAANWDRDSYSVYLEAGATYKFDVSGYNPTNRSRPADPILVLKDGNRQRLLYSDDANGTNDPSITFTAQSSGNYFLEIGAYYAGYQDNGFDYGVSAFQVSAPPIQTVSPNPPIIYDTFPTVDNSQVDNSSTVNNTTTNNVDNSISNTVTQNFTVTITGDNNSLGSFGNTTFQQSGTQGADILTGNSSEAASDVFRGMDGDDQLTGFRGADVLVGDAGNDIIRGGNGRDVLTGGAGADQIYGGFGQNTFTGELDGAVDRLYLQSDQWSYNWVYGSAGNQDGNKVDVIGALDTFDRITIQGVSDGLLTYGSTSTTIQGQQVSGIGIFAAGTLEAVYTGNNLSASQLDAMTTGSMLSL